MTTIPAQFVNDSGVVELEGSLVTSTPLSYPRIIGPFSFAYSDVGLNNGLPFYTPTIGDILLDVWLAIITDWDGTTPLGDIGPFAAPGDSGVFKIAAGAAVDVSNADTTDIAGLLWNSSTKTGLAEVSGANDLRYAPLLFQAATPLKFVVSQDGKSGGTDPGASQGAADIYVIVSTPELP